MATSHRKRSSSTATIVRFLTDPVGAIAESRRPSYTPPPVVVVNDGTHPEQDAEEEEEEVPLPPVGEFRFHAIMGHVSKEAEEACRSLNDAVHAYRQDLSTELDIVISAQNRLTEQMKYIDQLATRTMKDTQNRVHQVTAQANSLKDVDGLALAAEKSYNALSGIVSLLHRIDAKLPAKEMLVPKSSAHKSHYPNLHALLQSNSPVPRDGGNEEAFDSTTLKYPAPRRVASMSALSKRNHSDPLLLQSSSKLPDNYPRGLYRMRDNPVTQLTAISDEPPPAMSTGKRHSIVTLHDTIPYTETDSASTMSTFRRPSAVSTFTEYLRSKADEREQADDAETRLRKVLNHK
ncbi:hypothetical protein TRVA0_004S00408 [Trichomonascus vanleenenianus]|uniref:uncharacterized protein n=1 Tax=Trichomonascus vanleenenianus TaxID=2268995 RepID=UPI003ECB7E9B